MIDKAKLEARLDAALAHAKASRSDVQRAENEALDLMIQIGTHSARQAEAEVVRLQQELAQARADRALLAGLWLATVPPTKLPALLPANPADRYRLAAVLDAADVQPDFEACIAAGRAVIERIFADAEGDTGADARAADMRRAAERGAR